MKIVYFNYLANAIGPIIRTLELAKGCSENGINVALYFMHEGFNPPAFVYERIRAYQSEQLCIYYNDTHERQLEHTVVASNSQAAGEPVIRLRGLLKQSLLSLKYIGKERQIFKKERPDAVMARPDHAFSFCFSRYFLNLPLILDTDGPVEELDLYWGISSKGLKWLDTYRAKVSSAVLVVSRVCDELWQDKIKNRDKFFIVPNGTHIDEFCPQSQETRLPLLNQLGLHGCRVIGFSGNQRVWHGLPNLLKSARPLLEKDKNLKILIIGCGFNDELMQQCQIPETIFRKQVVFTGRLSYWDMATHIDLASLMVMPYERLELFYFSPMRMFEAMSLGKSLVTSKQGQMEDLLDEQASVHFFDPDKKGDLFQVLKASIYDDEFIQKGHKNRDYLIAEHSWHHRGAQVKEAIHYAVSHPK